MSDITCGRKEFILLKTILFNRTHNQLHNIVCLTFLTATKNVVVITQYTPIDRIETFQCSPGWNHYRFHETNLKIPLPNLTKSQDRKTLNESSCNFSAKPS